MPEFSPQTQAVWDAAYNTPEDCPYEHDLVADLRAAADQVVPKEIEPANAFEEEGYVPSRLREQRQETRRKLLAIADQLEAQ